MFDFTKLFPLHVSRLVEKRRNFSTLWQPRRQPTDFPVMMCPKREEICETVHSIHFQEEDLTNTNEGCS